MARRSRIGSFRIVMLMLVLAPGISCDDPNSGDLGKERAKHATKLRRKGPSPQKAPPVGPPPAGARAVVYPSNGMQLKAWISALPAAGAKNRPAVVYCHGGFAFG